MNIAKFSVKHPAVIGMILIVLVTFGIISVTGMNIAFMSDISMPEVMVLTIYPGAGAEDVEQDVTNICAAVHNCNELEKKAQKKCSSTRKIRRAKLKNH